MSKMNVCVVTGGAGFIGCAISEGLCKRFERVIAVDSMNPQIHAKQSRPAELTESVELLVGDVCDPVMWDRLLQTVEGSFAIIHLAAETGTSQSMNHATLHTRTNVLGTSQMLDAFTRNHKFPTQMLLTSSRAVYGEGQWEREEGQRFYPGQRNDEQLRRHQWDFENAHYIPSQADETAPIPTSVYAATKLCQENLMRVWGASNRVPLKILRFQNVYGRGQSLINPYTGIVSLFVQLARAGKSIPLYEDGNIIRDYVYIDDVACAVLMALDSASCEGKTIDVGTGKMTTICDVAKLIAQHYDAPQPHVTMQYRNGDVRHACCITDRTRQVIGFEAKVSVAEGIERLCTWIDEQNELGAEVLNL